MAAFAIAPLVMGVASKLLSKKKGGGGESEEPRVAPPAGSDDAFYNFLSAAQPRARGGPMSPGGHYLVGEEGPEVVVQGEDGGQVLSKEDLQRIAAVQEVLRRYDPGEPPPMEVAEPEPRTDKMTPYLQGLYDQGYPVNPKKSKAANYAVSATQAFFGTQGFRDRQRGIREEKRGAREREYGIDRRRASDETQAAQQGWRYKAARADAAMKLYGQMTPRLSSMPPEQRAYYQAQADWLDAMREQEKTRAGGFPKGAPGGELTTADITRMEKDANGATQSLMELDQLLGAMEQGQPVDLGPFGKWGGGAKGSLMGVDKNIQPEEYAEWQQYAVSKAMEDVATLQRVNRALGKPEPVIPPRIVKILQDQSAYQPGQQPPGASMGGGSPHARGAEAGGEQSDEPGFLRSVGRAIGRGLGVTPSDEPGVEIPGGLPQQQGGPDPNQQFGPARGMPSVAPGQEMAGVGAMPPLDIPLGMIEQSWENPQTGMTIENPSELTDEEWNEMDQPTAEFYSILEVAEMAGANTQDARVQRWAYEMVQMILNPSSVPSSPSPGVE